MSQYECKIVTCSDPAWIGLRLDKLLFAQFPTYSRSYFQDLVTNGAVTVNAQVPKNNYHIKLGDVIHITFMVKEYNLAPAPVDFDIIDQHPDFLIINKPAGLAVHPAANNPEEITLINGLIHRFKELAVLDDNQRPGIVHRIDKDTSGLLVIARNQQAQIELSAMFKDRKIHKKYLALVHKHPVKQGTIELPIGRHRCQRHKMTTFGIEARPAFTSYNVLNYYDEYTLLETTITTGRTHQIRVHCASMGNPIVGDEMYGSPSKMIGRQALHAWHIAFEYKGKPYSYTCPVPADFKEILRILLQQKLQNQCY